MNNAVASRSFVSAVSFRGRDVSPLDVDAPGGGGR